MKRYDIIIIGAGVVSAFIAREISKYKLSCLVLEKENEVGNATSAANSAIIHSGYDPLPNTLKAKLNKRGNELFDSVAKELDVRLSKIGSLTVAINDEQVKVLKRLYQRAKENNVEVSLLSKEETLKLEPNLTGEVRGSLLAKTCGIINCFTLTHHAFENAIDNGVELKLNQEVIDIKKDFEGFEIHTQDNVYYAKYVINSAGLGAYKIASLINKPTWNIKPRKGQYYVLDHFGSFVKHVIFPLPSEKGKGILITPTTSGNYLLGPSSEYVDDIDDVSTDLLTLKDVKRQINSLIKDIPYEETVRIFAGLRTSSDRKDFIIETDKDNHNFLNLAGIESPGLASSPAIGEYVISNFISKYFLLENKNNFNPCVRPYTKMKEMTIDKRNEVIKKDADFGHILCYCEQITLGEVKELLSRSVPVSTIKGIKKLLRIGFGKCQGGFCQSGTLIELAKHFNIELTNVLYDKNGSEILIDKSKRGDKE